MITWDVLSTTFCLIIVTISSLAVTTGAGCDLYRQ